MKKQSALIQIESMMSRTDELTNMLKAIKKNLPGETYYTIKGMLKIVNFDLEWAIPQLKDENEEND